MNSGQLNMFHNRRNKHMFSITDGICFAFRRMMQEPVDQNRTVRRHAHGLLHIEGQGFVVVDYFHPASAQHIGRAHHDRIADPVGGSKRFLYVHCHACLRHGDLQTLHHLPEQIPVLCQINGLRCGAQNIDSVFLQICRQIQRRLSSELCNHTHRFFLFIDGKHVLQGQRFKIQLVRGIIIRRHGLRIAVDDDRGKSQLPQSLCRMDTAVIKLDALSNPVGSAAQDHHFRPVRIHRAFIFHMIAGIIVSAVLCTAHMNAFPGLHDPVCRPPVSDGFLGHPENPA